MQPTKPGYYWALWVKAADGTTEAELQVWPKTDWIIVEVWENCTKPRCEADRAEWLAVSVPGYDKTQWLENFKWGNPVPSKLYVEGLEHELAKQQVALDKLAKLGNEPYYGNSIGNQIAIDALGLTARSPSSPAAPAG